jgi:hypothetical protein
MKADFVHPAVTDSPPTLRPASQVLLPFVKDTKQGDAFREKLCQRFEALQEESAATAADFAAAQAAAQAAQGGEDSCVMAGSTEASRDGVARQSAELEVQEHPHPAGTCSEAPTAATTDQAPSGPAQPAVSGTTAAQAAQAMSVTTGQGHTGGTSSHSKGVAREWHALAMCLQEMGHSEKGARRVLELLRCYKHALGDRKVYAVFAVSKLVFMNCKTVQAEADTATSLHFPCKDMIGMACSVVLPLHTVDC